MTTPLLAQTPGADGQRYIFDIGALVDHLDALPLETFAGQEKPFGPPTTSSAATVSEGGGLTYGRVSIKMDKGDAHNEVEFFVFETAAVAEEEFSVALLTNEARGKDGTYRYRSRKIAGTDADGKEIAFTCASARPDEMLVTQVRCAFHPENSQVVIGTYGESQPIDQDLKLFSFMIDVSRPIEKARDVVAQAEAALIERGGLAAWPEGGWRLDAQNLIRQLQAMAFDGSEAWPEAFGAPHGTGFEQPTNRMRELGLAGRALVPLNTPQTRNGLEFWVFETSAQRDADDVSVPMLATPEGNAAGSITSVSISRTSADLVLRGVRCARVEDAPGRVAQEGRCLYRRPGSQVAIVAYAYGAPVDAESGGWSRFTGAGLDAIAVGLDKLAAVEVPLIAALRGGGPAPQPKPDYGALLQNLQTNVATPPANKIDTAIVGTWQLYVPSGPAFSRLQLVIDASGSYAFTSDNPGIAPHSGAFMAQNGSWAMNSAAWQDGGTYSFPDARTMILIGKLGPGAWSKAN